MADRILLEDVRFWAQHGLTQAEVAVGAWFRVDAELVLDLEPAGATDDLARTVDYGAVIRRLVELGTGSRVRLLERLASLLAGGLLAAFPVDEVRVRVQKLTPPLQGLVGIPGVEVVRRRR